MRILRFDAFIVLICLVILSCKEKRPVESNKVAEQQMIKDVEIDIHDDYDQSKWTELNNEMGFELDIKYATVNNFTKEAVYECGRCFLRPALADILIRINKEIQAEGYRIKLFDCYRPLGVQEELWAIVPNPIYVTDPKKGSMHNRGLAVDLSLVDKDGIELDMGTAFDFFGKESHPSYADFPEEILSNRKTLFDLMLKHGLKGINSEWWHYSLQTEKAEISDWQWECN